MADIHVITILIALLIPLLLCILIILLMFREFGRGLYSYILNECHGIFTKSKSIHALGRIVADRKCPKDLPPLDVFERVSPICVRVLGLNPGAHTLQGTNTWLLGSGDERMLVDTGEDITCTEYVQLLFEKVFPATGTKALSAILLTHGHGDHQGGVLAILSELARRRMAVPKVYKRIVACGDFPAKGFECVHIDDDQLFKLPGCTIRSVYTPGHTDDHVAFILIEDNALLSGDCILGCGTTVFDKLKPYMNSLQRLKTMAVAIKNKETDKVPESSATSVCGSCHSGDILTCTISKIYPGHGPVVHDALLKIEEYIEHRNVREKQIFDVVSQSDRYLSSWELVGKVYPVLPVMVKFSAQRNLSLHLEKLLEEKKIECKYPDLWTCKR
jgi:ribonuclease/clavin/mitogillin